MENKILPIFDTPELREIHTSAYMLSMLHTCKNFSEKWILKNCINIYYANEFNEVLTYSYSAIWFLKYFKSHINLLCPIEKVIDKIKHEIDKDFYLIICVNEFYIPNRRQVYNRTTVMLTSSRLLFVYFSFVCST